MTVPTMAEVVLHRVVKRFGDVAAVSDLSLSIADGELIVLLGPTGAGKTTTLRLIAGLERPDAGRIAIGGQDLTAAPPPARDVAFVFQQYSLYPHLSVYDNLAFPLRSPIRRVPEDEIRRKVGEVASLLRITAKLGNRATQLSGGEMQRVAIARALVHSPSLVLADEPTGNLDETNAAAVLDCLRAAVKDAGAAALMVTHSQRAAGAADRVLHLAGGRITPP
jgi:multiple sugar transport system ATP-binding protein